MKWLAYTASVVLGTAIALGIAALKPADGVENEDFRIVRLHDGSSTTMGVWYDTHTGCQYLSYRKDTGLTPRLKPDGTPLCTGPLARNGSP